MELSKESLIGKSFNKRSNPDVIAIVTNVNKVKILGLDEYEYHVFFELNDSESGYFNLELSEFLRSYKKAELNIESK